MKKFKFIDLFAGLGGFHFALESLGGDCVFASELKEDLQKLYKINFPGTRIVGDITKVELKDIPPHDVLCAGFPCQPFSQAGKRQGFNDVERGNLFYTIRDIVKFRRPRFVFLENVANLKGHDSGRTWQTIKGEFESLNYEVAEPQILSPHQFGIPQHRKRVYIVCENRDYGCLEDFKFPVPRNTTCDIKKIVNESDLEYIKIKKETREQLDAWEDFLSLCEQNNVDVPSFPIWTMEFGATYSFEDVAPAYNNPRNFIGQRGIFGVLITNQNIDANLSVLPNYSRRNNARVLPKWKIRYIKENRKFFEKNEEWLRPWLDRIRLYENSHLKFEWNCGKNVKKTLRDKIVQYRASGIRVKLPTFAPALNLCGTQLPILPWVKVPSAKERGRYLTRHEAALLQGMKNIKFGKGDFQLSMTRSFEALGNAVNVILVRKIAERLVKQ